MKLLLAILAALAAAYVYLVIRPIRVSLDEPDWLAEFR